MKRPASTCAVFGAVTLLAACAAVPPDNDGVDSVAFVQHGSKPLAFRTGVVDGSSFRASYGDAISMQLDAGEEFDAFVEGEQARQDSLRDSNAAVAESLFDEHPLADRVAESVLPTLAAHWKFEFDEMRMHYRPANTLFVDPRSDTLKGDVPSADLVLMIEVDEAVLTERFSVQAAMLNGVTFGAAPKQLTFATPVNLLAFRRDAADGDLHLVWSRRCGGDYTSMQNSARIAELWDDPARVERILDEAAERSAAHCRKALSNAAGLHAQRVASR